MPAAKPRPDQPKTKTVAHQPEDRVPDPEAEPSNGDTRVSRFKVELPAGGEFEVSSAAEVEMWNTVREGYVEDYQLVKRNDLVALGSILTHNLILFRAQAQLASNKNLASNAEQIEKSSKAIRDAEKALGLDKVSREKGGTQSVPDYVAKLKKVGFDYGVHISDRVKAYEQLAMDLRWRIRLLRNGDVEDRAYHHVQTEKEIIEFAERTLAALEQKDVEWAREKGALFVGTL